MKFSADEFAGARLGLVPADYQAASTDGTGVDAKGFDECLVVLNSGTNTGAATLDIIVEDSADNSTFAAITGAAFTQLVAANDNTPYVGRIDLRKYKRYLRINAVGDAANAAIAGVMFIFLNHNQGPATQTNTVGFDV